MTTEQKARKNTDYSASAENLTNPLELELDLRAIKGLGNQIAELQTKIDSLIPIEMKDLMTSLQVQLNAATQGAKSDIDTYGSYQDLVNGMYAVKQRKVSVSYNPERFKRLYPQFAPAVIIETVDTTKLDGLIKGGLIDAESLKHPNVRIASEKVSYVYIVKV
jgi:hypothetical protein